MLSALTTSGKSRKGKPLVLRGHSKSISWLAAVGGRYVWSASMDKRLCVWDIKTMGLVKAWELSGNIICGSVLQSVVWTSCLDKSVTIWDANDPFIKRKDVLVKVDNPICCFGVVKDMIWGGSFDYMQIWTLRYSQIAELCGHEGKVQCLVQTRRHVWSGGQDARIIVWDKKTYQQVTTLETQHKLGITAFCALSKEVWSASEDLTIRSWCSETFRHLRIVCEVRDVIYSLVVVVDDVWAGCKDGSIFILPSSKVKQDGVNYMCIVNEDECKYVGEVCSDGEVKKRHGFGEDHFTSGAIYVGEFQNDKRHGYGVFTEKNGDKYYGEWQNGMREGFGIEIYGDGSCYCGRWSENFRFGDGEQVYPNGDRLVGEWRDNVFRGSVIRSGPAYIQEKYPLILWQSQASSAVQALVDAEFEEPCLLSTSKWQGFITCIRASDLKHDVQLMITMGDETKAEEYLNRVVQDNMHILGQALQRFRCFFVATYQPTVVNNRLAAQQLLCHAVHDIHSFTNAFCDHLHMMLNVVVSKEQIARAVDATIWPRIYPTLFALFTRRYKDEDAAFEAKLLNLENTSLADVGAQVRARRLSSAAMPDDLAAAKAAVAACAAGNSPSVSSLPSPSPKNSCPSAHLATSPSERNSINMSPIQKRTVLEAISSESTDDTMTSVSESSCSALNGVSPSETSNNTVLINSLSKQQQQQLQKHSSEDDPTDDDDIDELEDEDGEGAGTSSSTINNKIKSLSLIDFLAANPGEESDGDDDENKDGDATGEKSATEVLRTSNASSSGIESHHEPSSTTTTSTTSVEHAPTLNRLISSDMEDSYAAAVESFRSLSTAVTPRDKVVCLHLVYLEVLRCWERKGVQMSKQGADDFMPVLVYVLIKARVPNLVSEFAFLDEFFRSNPQEEETDEQSYTGKRLRDFKVAMSFARIVDLNVRDEHGVVIPVNQLCERIVSSISSSSRNHLDKTGSNPRTLWMAEILNRLSSRGARTYTPLVLQEREARMALQYWEVAAKAFASVGLQLNKNEDHSEISLTFERSYPMYVYSELAQEVSSFSLKT